MGVNSKGTVQDNAFHVKELAEQAFELYKKDNNQGSGHGFSLDDDMSEVVRYFVRNCFKSIYLTMLAGSSSALKKCTPKPQLPRSRPTKNKKALRVMHGPCLQAAKGTRL